VLINVPGKLWRSTHILSGAVYINTHTRTWDGVQKYSFSYLGRCTKVLIFIPGAVYNSTHSYLGRLQEYSYSYLGRCEDLGHADMSHHNCASSTCPYQHTQDHYCRHRCKLRRTQTATRHSDRGQASRSQTTNKYLHTETEDMKLT
jgi:hypothetical protein